MLGSAPGGPALERLTKKDGAPPVPDYVVPNSAGADYPGTAGPAFPDGTEGQGIWAGTPPAGSDPGGPPPFGGQPPSYLPGDPYGPASLHAPPPPARPNNTLKLVLWSVGACCGCSLLFFVGMIGFGFYLNDQEKKNGTSTFDDPSQPADSTDFGGDMDAAARLDGIETAYGLTEQVEAASEAEVDDWAEAQQFGASYVPQDALVYACAAGNAPVVKTLLAQGGADASSVSMVYGVSPLHAASYNNFLDCLAVVIANGGDVNQDLSGETGTPLHQAAMGNALDTARLLLSCGAEVEALNGLGLTPLHCAANSNADGVAQLLIGANAVVDTPTQNEGNTALMLAANIGSLETGQVLIDAGANVNFADPEFGLTALHVAALKGNGPFVQMLLEAGANPYLRASDGQKPQDSAIAGGYNEIAEMLK